MVQVRTDRRPVSLSSPTRAEARVTLFLGQLR